MLNKYTREKIMYSTIKQIMVAILLCSTIAISFAETTISADVVSRYVWRGTDFGNAAAVQPGIETAVGPVTVGAWGSWALNGADGGNECDLYASFTAGPVGITVTDYFFPAYEGDGLLDLDNHVIEFSAGLDIGPVSVLAAANVSGDSFVSASDTTYSTGVDDWNQPSYDMEVIETDTDRNSLYLELGYGAFSVGLGNGVYTADEDESKDSFGVVSIGVSASRDNFSASYIINPDQETSFLVFGVSF